MPKKNIDKVKTAIDTFIEMQPKASLRTMKEIVSEFNGIPTNIVDADGNLDFDVLTRLITVGVRQVDPTITEDEVADGVDMDNLHGAMQAATNFITMTLPEGLIPAELAEDDDEEVTEEEEAKN